MELGLVTYNLAKDWDVETLIRNCELTGFRAVELRTTHAHGVETGLPSTSRAEVRKRFEDSGVRLLSLGTTCEFHSADRAIVDANIRECGEFVRLAGDVGAAGVKVRPNGLPEGVPIPDTLARIAHALQVCGEDARPFGVEIWLEVHGRGTCELPHIETILNHVDLPNVRACWNSNPQDLEPGGGLEANIARVAGRIGNVHINTLWGEYPYRELFKLLRESGYAGYCLAELGSGSTDPIPLMHCYHALFRELCRA